MFELVQTLKAFCASKMIKRSSYKEHRVNALALGAEEGRSKLRKAMVSRKQALTHGFPNGETHLS